MNRGDQGDSNGPSRLKIKPLLSYEQKHFSMRRKKAQGCKGRREQGLGVKGWEDSRPQGQEHSSTGWHKGEMAQGCKSGRALGSEGARAGHKSERAQG